MQLDKDGDGFVLASGREIYANCCIIGITESFDLEQRIEIFEGYDGTLPDDFTKEERKEIAEYAISLWRRYAELD